MVLVQDEITGVPEGESILWNMMTRVDAALSDDHRTVALSHKDQTMSVQLVTPGDARFALKSAAPGNDFENPNKGWQRLVIDDASTGEDHTIRVLFVPGSSQATEWEKTQLMDWK